MVSSSMTTFNQRVYQTHKHLSLRAPNAGSQDGEMSTLVRKFFFKFKYFLFYDDAADGICDG